MSSDQPIHEDLPDAVAVPLVEPLPTGARIVEGSHVRPVPQETREEIIRAFGNWPTVDARNVLGRGNGLQERLHNQLRQRLQRLDGHHRQLLLRQDRWYDRLPELILPDRLVGDNGAEFFGVDYDDMPALAEEPEGDYDDMPALVGDMPDLDLGSDDSDDEMYTNASKAA
jgi:hypothetical protein